MTPTRKRRLIVISLVLGAVAVATTLTVFALQQNMNYLFTPGEVMAGKVSGDTRFRLGGMVKHGSIVRDQASLKVDFIVTDGDVDMPVEYVGILPDLFREDQAVIATGHMDGNRFSASVVLAKHDEKYMPKELASAMGKAHVKHKVGTPEASSAAEATQQAPQP